ncbi:hypothetical protein HanIR_Chr15g0740431 [Helianthus annuus]|nr:hypothetical protein HanIR_Chr15g0740431 [Helianthus annuus]
MTGMEVTCLSCNTHSSAIYIGIPFYFQVLICLSLSLKIFIFLIFIYNNNRALPRFKCFNSRSPLPFPIDLSPITHVKALPD